MKTLRHVAAWMAIAVMASPVAHAAGFWPFKDNKKHPGVTIHGGAQHEVKPLGYPLHPAKPIGSTRKQPRTILANRPY